MVGRLYKNCGSCVGESDCEELVGPSVRASKQK